MLVDLMFVVLASARHTVAAVTREINALGVAGHGDDFGNWHIAPNLGDVSNSAIENSPTPPLATNSVPPAIDEMKAKYKRVCATQAQYTCGGLSNTMGIINAPMEYSLLNGLSWIMPAVYPPDHAIGDSFSDMFGSVNVSCPEKPIPKWEAQCFKTHDETGTSDNDHHWIGEWCRPNEMELEDSVPSTIVSTLCGCDAIIEFRRKSNWHFNYKVTGPVLSSLYWKDKDIPDFSFPISTIHHVRLGDVEGKSWGNFVTGFKMATMVKAFARSSQIDAKCLEVTIVTDGEGSDEHVATVTRAWKNMGVESVQISDINDPVEHAFALMTHSGILLGGPSGFPRLAAVLSRSRVKLFYDDEVDSHPIEDLSGTTTFPAAADFEEIREAMLKNSELASLVQDCRRWLSR